MRSGPVVGTLLAALALSACTHAPPAQPPPRAAPEAAPPDLIDEYFPLSIFANEKTDTPECKRIKADFEAAWNQAVVCRTDGECAQSIGGKCTAARPDAKEMLGRKMQALGDCVEMIGISICEHTTPICFRGRCKVRGCQEKGDVKCS
jgi:hypothetical protein